MLWRIPKHPSRRPHPEGFIVPAQPTLVTKPVTAPGWMHEIKHDGYRMVARRFPDGRVALWSRNGIAWTDRLPLIKAALLSLPVESVTLDGEAIAPHPDGTSNFSALRRRGGNVQAVLMAFDILELNGEDLRPLPLWHRREVLQGVTLFGHEGLRLSEPIDAPGDVVFRAACQHGLEGIVSKRLDSAYRSGRVKSWVKTKCPGYQRRITDGPLWQGAVRRLRSHRPALAGLQLALTARRNVYWQAHAKSSHWRGFR